MSQTTSFIIDFIRHLLSATANASLYGMEHPQVARLSVQAYNSLIKALEDRLEFSLIIIEHELVVDGQPQEFSLFLNRFAQVLSSRGIGHIRVIQGIERSEVNEFIAAIACQGGESNREVNSSEHLRLGWIEIGHSENSGNARDKENDFQSISGIFSETCKSEINKEDEPIAISQMAQAEIDRFMEIYEAVKRHHKLRINGIVEIVSSFINAHRQEGEALLVMAALRLTDEYTFTHSSNVSILNIAQASFLGIKGQLLNDIGVAGMLHDIGKLFIPEEILTKTEELNPHEFEIVKSHPVKGARYLLETTGVPRLAVINAFEHHLKYDMSGYPEVPNGWQQNICSQITAISDTFDALRTRRSYREPLEMHTIVQMMQELIGTQLHPLLTKNFLSIISELTKQCDH